MIARKLPQAHVAGFTVQRMAVIDLSKLTPLIQRAAQEISARLH